MSAAVAGGRSALGRLLLWHYDAMLSVAHRFGIAPPDDEDVVQEAARRASEAIAHFQWQGPRSFGNWLATIVSRAAVDRYRERGARHRPAGWAAFAPDESMIGLLSRVPDPGRTPGSLAAAEDLANAVRLVMADLHEPYRVALSLRYLEGLVPEEMAARMGLAPRQVYNLCHHGLNALREAFFARFGTF